MVTGGGADLQRSTCGVDAWGESQKHWTSVRRKSCLDPPQEVPAVESAPGVGDGRHAGFPFDP